jgi:hypothetical protein
MEVGVLLQPAAVQMAQLLAKVVALLQPSAVKMVRLLAKVLLLHERHLAHAQLKESDLIL